jgi:phosphatidate cytidylyltransferase
VGRSVGGPKLYSAISPNKTVSGSIGGFFASLAGGAIAKLFFVSVLSWGEVTALSLLLGGVGQLGDLVESMFKRSSGVKDSSSIIPAHGGAMDKLDGVAFATPLLYYCIVWLRQG